MKTRITLAVLLISFTSIISSCGNNSSVNNVTNGDDDSAQIAAVYEVYRNAILNADGEKAAEVVAPSTFNAYDKWDKWINSANEEEVKELANMDKFMVLLMRYKNAQNPYNGTSGKDCFIYGVENKMIDESLIQQSQVEGITIDGNNARMDIESNGQVYLLFTKVDGEWKLDMQKLLEMATTDFNKMEIPNEQFLQMIQTQFEDSIPDNIWEPLGN